MTMVISDPNVSKYMLRADVFGRNATTAFETARKKCNRFIRSNKPIEYVDRVDRQIKTSGAASRSFSLALRPCRIVLSIESFSKFWWSGCWGGLTFTVRNAYANLSCAYSASIQCCNCPLGTVLIGHGYESKTFAFLGIHICYNRHAADYSI